MKCARTLFLVYEMPVVPVVKVYKWCLMEDSALSLSLMLVHPEGPVWALKHCESHSRTLFLVYKMRARTLFLVFEMRSYTIVSVQSGIVAGPSLSDSL